MADIQITPISHASIVLKIGDVVVYNDPVGGVEAYTVQAPADIILISDIHGDHLEPETVGKLATPETVIVVPQAVKDQLPESLPGTVIVLANGQTTTQKGITIHAIPMYNIPESTDAFHPKGRGNGYILESEGKKVYLAGDTSNIPEIGKLENIDIAFIPMNLPYTMDVKEAADAVLSFKPTVVHPYHYRGQDGFADIEEFKKLVNERDPSITVDILDFYPEEK